MLAEILYGLKQTIYAIFTPETETVKNRPVFAQIPYALSDAAISQFPPQEYILVNGIGAIPGNDLRHRLAVKFRAMNYEFLSVIASSACVSDYILLGSGVQVLSKAIIHPGCTIGDDAIINSGAIVEHDCQIGAYSHIASGAVLSGGVTTGSHVHIGTNATVIQGRVIAGNSTVGAGAIVSKDIVCASVVYPAKPYVRSGEHDG